MDSSSPLSAPPSSPPPQSPQPPTSRTPLPGTLSSELSDLSTTTPTISASEDESSRGRSVKVKEYIVGDTQKLWNRKRGRGYNFEMFVEGWLLQTTTPQQSGSRMRQMRKVLKKDSIRRRLREAGIEIRFEEDPMDPEIVDVDTLRTELLALSSQSAFNKFDPKAFRSRGDQPCAVKDFRDAQWAESTIRGASSQMQDQSPRLVEFLSAVLANERAGQNSYNSGKPKAPPVAKEYMIASLLLSSIAPLQSNLLPQTISIYLHSNGVQRQVIDTLTQFGICSSYKTTLRKWTRWSTNLRDILAAQILL